MQDKDPYRTSRVLYIIEVAFEYFISILVTDTYLAKLTASLGMSDSLTGILTSFLSLGCGFQMAAVFLAHKRPVKRWVTLLNCLNQLSFSLLYLVPFIRVSRTVKTMLFIAFLLAAHVLKNIASAPKVNWFMSLVDDSRRGSFTANKEIVSLTGGMVFSFVMGAAVDRFEATGNLRGAFVVCGITVFCLMLLRCTLLLLSKEIPAGEREKISAGKQTAALIRDRNLFKVIAVPILWSIVTYVSTPFYGSYQIKELGFSMTFVSVLSAVYAVVRTLFSKPLGRFADTHSFSGMLNICFCIMLFAFGINIFTVPGNGKILFTAYYVLNAAAMAGINSATLNLIYDYVEPDRRVGALALQGTLSGFAGFFATLAVTPLVNHIQKSGNTLFGFGVYAQQVVSALAVLLLAVLIVYLNRVVRKIRTDREHL